MLGYHAGDFETIDIATFDSFLAPSAESDLLPDNYCPHCDIPMEISGAEYKCHDCGFIGEKEDIIQTDKSDNVSANIKISTGARKGHHYNVSCDYSRTQRQNILAQLKKRHELSTALNIPKDVLEKVVLQYNTIQRTINSEIYNEDGVCIRKKFVRRGNIKDEVLAALIYFECIEQNLMRRKKNIAAFMGLRTSGFARGEDILRDLEAEGIIVLPEPKDPARGFAERYMEALGLDNPEYVDFIVDLVETSEIRRIGMTIHLPSKVVGAIWIVITSYNLGISSATLEKTADNIKKNTFIRFSQLVMNTMHIFKDVFIEHNVPI